MTCPSELALESYLLDPHESPWASHVRGCPRCVRVLDQMKQEESDFRRFVFPATVDAVVARRPAHASWSLRLPTLAGALGAALLALWVAPREPAPEYLGAKGELSLAVFVGSPAGAQPVADGDRVPAGAELRFRLSTQTPCHAWVVSVDESGLVSQLFPAQGTGGALVSSGVLPGGALLDGRHGPERLFALCGRDTLQFGDIEAAAHAAIPVGAHHVREVSFLPRLPNGVRQTSVLLEKSP